MALAFASQGAVSRGRRGGASGATAAPALGSRAAVSGRGAAALRAGPRARRAAPGRGCVGAQANLFSRFGRVIKSYANALVDSAEDVEKVTEVLVQEMQDDLIKMRQASAQVMASQKQLENKYKAAQETADDWYRRAQLALQKGDEELAREALKRRQSFQENADSMKTQLATQTEATQKLIDNTRILEQKLAEAKAKKDTLKARAASAKTSQKVNEMVQNVGTSNAYAAFEKMEQKVLSLEANADAVAELGAAGTADANLEDKFKALEGNSVDDELAKMKGQMLGGSTGPSGALPEGRPVSDAIESELQELRRKAKDL